MVRNQSMEEWQPLGAVFNIEDPDEEVEQETEGPKGIHHQPRKRKRRSNTVFISVFLLGIVTVAIISSVLMYTNGSRGRVAAGPPAAPSTTTTTEPEPRAAPTPEAQPKPKSAPTTAPTPEAQPKPKSAPTADEFFLDLADQYLKAEVKHAFATTQRESDRYMAEIRRIGYKFEHNNVGSTDRMLWYIERRRRINNSSSR